MWITVNAQGALALMEDELVQANYIGTPSVSEINKVLFPTNCRPKVGGQSVLLTRT